MAPLYNLLKMDYEFSWDFDYATSFLQLKEVLTTKPILRGPKWGLSFHIHTYASDYAIGVELGKKVKLVEHAIYFIDKKLQGAEFNYIVTEKELLAVIYALNQFKHYIIGYEIFVHTYHSAIKYLMNNPTILGRLA